MRPHLLASLGNPGPTYANTLHSAGHTLLRSLIRHSAAPPPTKDASYAALTSVLPSLLFWQSPSYMNVSGPALARAWRWFRSEHALNEPVLVVLHDELEIPLGSYKIRKDTVGTSARGHNGLRSVLSQPGMVKERITRVGVGIGRPVSREPEVVAEYVLRRMSAGELASVEGCAEGVWRGLGLG